MNRHVSRVSLFVAVGLLAFWWPNAQAQQKPDSDTVQVHLVITDEAVREDQELPPLRLEDVKVKQGKNPLKVTQLIRATGENAALQLMILIDDTLDTSVGNSLTELKEFIAAQPPTTVIAVGYMANAGVNIAQNFTPDHDLAVKALRLPRGTLSTMDSPYLSLISLVKSWPPQKVRREVLIVSDGIDRLRGEKPELSNLSPDYGAVYLRGPTTALLTMFRKRRPTRACRPSASMRPLPAKLVNATTSLCIRFMRPALGTRAEVPGTGSLGWEDCRRSRMNPAEIVFRWVLHNS